jgi:SAM-dependent methyltransferase
MDDSNTLTDGGYNDGYRACACFWGREPGSLVQQLQSHIGDFSGLEILDAGCGEGKNAIFLARLGARVRAMDISQLAIDHGMAAWDDSHLVRWELADVRSAALPESGFAVVVAYGLLHCLEDMADVRNTVRRLQRATVPGGYNVLCSFNERAQDLRAHPGFTPCLAPHSWYVSLYTDWTLLHESDADLREVHPHNSIPHSHSMTRILARRDRGP